jgi:hypothetical protein
MERKIFLCILLIYILGYSTHAIFLHKTAYGDGVYYYSWLRSVTIDHDINFANEYARLGGSQPTTALGYIGNKYAIGPALLWAPWFLWTHSIIRGSGYEFPYQFVIGLSGVLYAFTGLVLTYGILSKYFTKAVSIISVIGIAGATNLLFYGSLDTVNSHAMSFFASAVFLALLLRPKQNWFLVGCSLGLVGVIRMQDAVLGLLALPYLSKKTVTHFLAGFLSLFSLQLVAWQILYGTFWMSPYISDIEGFNVLRPHILGVLFSPENGLFLWTPMVAIGLVGLFMGHKNLPLKRMAIVLVVSLYVVASWSVWWQGASYSGRMFVSILPIIALGVANVFSKFHTGFFRFHILLWAITLPLVTTNVLFILYFLAKT